MDKKTAFLELKYGWVYGGSPKFHIISDIALIMHSEQTDRITVHTKAIRSNTQIVTSYSDVDELGVTKRRIIEVLDMNNRRTRAYHPDFILNNRLVKNIIAQSYTTHRVVKNFIVGLLLEHRPDELVIFGGRRDIKKKKKAGVRFHKIPKITDTQELLKNETDHLFSLNKISKVIGYDQDINKISSNNEEYYLPRFITRQLEPNTAADDAVRAFLAHQEYVKHKDHLLIRAALQLQKIEMAESERKEAEANNSPTE
ncbi:MAG: hypothetical protein AB8F94_15440 [Saprospiraceae bacterium]